MTSHPPYLSSKINKSNGLNGIDSLQTLLHLQTNYVQLHNLTLKEYQVFREYFVWITRKVLALERQEKFKKDFCQKGRLCPISWVRNSPSRQSMGGRQSIWRFNRLIPPYWKKVALYIRSQMIKKICKSQP